MKWNLSQIGSALFSNFIFIKSPTRLFHLPDLNQFERVYLILSTIHFDVVEQDLNGDNFRLSLIRETLGETLDSFRSEELTIRGRKLSNSRWEVQISIPENQVLDEIMLVLGWQNYLIS